MCASPSAPPPSSATPIFRRSFGAVRGASWGADGSCATAKIGSTSRARTEKTRRIKFLREGANSSELGLKFVVGSWFQQARNSEEFRNQADLFSCKMLPPSTSKHCPVIYEAA